MKDFWLPPNIPGPNEMYSAFMLQLTGCLVQEIVQWMVLFLTNPELEAQEKAPSKVGGEKAGSPNNWYSKKTTLFFPIR